MAKKNNAPQEPEIENTIETEGTTEEVATTENPAVEETNEIPAEEQEKPSTKVRVAKPGSVKGVRIHTSEEIDCVIACVPYRFGKNKEVVVPADVAAILCNAKVAFRL